MLLQMALLHSFSWLSSIPLCITYTPYIFVIQSSCRWHLGHGFLMFHFLLPRSSAVDSSQRHHFPFILLMAFRPWISNVSFPTAKELSSAVKPKAGTNQPPNPVFVNLSLGTLYEFISGNTPDAKALISLDPV